MRAPPRKSVGRANTDRTHNVENSKDDSLFDWGHRCGNVHALIALCLGSTSGLLPEDLFRIDILSALCLAMRSASKTTDGGDAATEFRAWNHGDKRMAQGLASGCARMVWATVVYNRIQDVDACLSRAPLGTSPGMPHRATDVCFRARRPRLGRDRTRPSRPPPRPSHRSARRYLGRHGPWQRPAARSHAPLRVRRPRPRRSRRPHRRCSRRRRCSAALLRLSPCVALLAMNGVTARPTSVHST